MTADAITTGLGTFSREKFKALVSVRHRALSSLRRFFYSQGYIEVTTSSLVNIAGSCENPYASFTLPYYGREAHLSQSAQLQLETLVGRLGMRVFTVNNSFREESYEDPEAYGRRLSEFTLLEPEAPYNPNLGPEEALKELRHLVELTIKSAVRCVLQCCESEIAFLGGDVDYLKRSAEQRFQVLTYEEALSILNKLPEQQNKLQFGDDLGIGEERNLLRYFENCPTFVTMYPSSIKFFNMKRTEDERMVYSLDLLTPSLGETVGGAVREVDGDKVVDYLRHSRVGEILRKEGKDPTLPFTEYLALFEEGNMCPRFGFGIGFERLVGFLLQSNDILHTVAYRTLSP